MDFFAVSLVVDIESCKEELILIPKCSILYLHSNYTNSLKNYSLKKIIVIKIIVKKPHPCACNQSWIY